MEYQNILKLEPCNTCFLYDIWFCLSKQLNIKANSATMVFGFKKGQVFIADASFA